MISKLVANIFCLGAILCLTIQVNSHSLPADQIRPAPNTNAQGEQDWLNREELNQSYRLSLGARIEVTMVNGPVDIETTDTDLAEVHIVRSARTGSDLNLGKINIDYNSKSLVVQGEQERSEEPIKVRHRVRLRLPRLIELVVHKVNARLNVGEVEGPVRISHINGAVTVARAAKFSEVSHINGSLNMVLTRIGGQGIAINRINGGVDLRFADNLNADLRITEFNDVSVRLENVEVIEGTARTLYRARIGKGNNPIAISHVNGNVRISFAGSMIRRQP